MVVVGVGLIAQLTFILPNWLVMLVVAELVGGWDLLKDIGVVELVQTQVKSAELSLEKLSDMIPKYKGE
jgi:hypothetical protein